MLAILKRQQLPATLCGRLSYLQYIRHTYNTANRSRVNMASANAAVNQNAVAVGLEDLKNGMDNGHVACDKTQLH